MSFPRFFNADELGKTLKEVATEYVNKDGYHVVSRWFHSAKDADLYFWLNDGGSIIKQQLSFYGQVVEWNLLEGIKTGHVMEFEQKDGVRASEVVQFDSEPQRQPIEQAVDVLRAVAGLTEQERESLISSFLQSGSSAPLTAEEFVKKFGSLLPPKRKSTSQLSWLTWIRGLFR